MTILCNEKIGIFPYPSHLAMNLFPTLPLAVSECAHLQVVFPVTTKLLRPSGEVLTSNSCSKPPLMLMKEIHEHQQETGSPKHKEPVPQSPGIGWLQSECRSQLPGNESLSPYVQIFLLFVFSPSSVACTFQKKIMRKP